MHSSWEISIGIDIPHDISSHHMKWAWCEAWSLHILLLIHRYSIPFPTQLPPEPFTIFHRHPAMAPGWWATLHPSMAGHHAERLPSAPWPRRPYEVAPGRSMERRGRRTGWRQRCRWFPTEGKKILRNIEFCWMRSLSLREYTPTVCGSWRTSSWPTKFIEVQFQLSMCSESIRHTKKVNFAEQLHGCVVASWS